MGLVFVVPAAISSTADGTKTVSTPIMDGPNTAHPSEIVVVAGGNPFSRHRTVTTALAGVTEVPVRMSATPTGIFPPAGIDT